MSQRTSALRSKLFEDVSEADLQKLQMQYCSAAKAKRSYAEKTHRQLYRDNREIQRLKDEQEELLSSLRAHQSCFNRQKDAGVAQDLTAMLAREDRIEKELEEERRKVAALKEQILVWERKKAGLSRGTVRHTSNFDNSYLLKNTSSMENKLHVNRKCLNQLITRNNQLREDLKVLQKDKKQFLFVKSQLENELREIRKDVNKLRTKCTEDFNTSVKIQEKQRMLRDQSAKDMAQFMKERSKLEQEISYHTNYERFADTKSTARIYQEVDHRAVEQPKQLEFKEWGPQDFEDAIRKIIKETGESDLDKLIRNFIHMEEQNYTLLNFVNHQHNEAEALQRHISQLCNEIKLFDAKNQQQLSQNQALLRKASTKQEAVKQQHAGYRQHVGFMEKLLDQIKKGVKSMLQISFDSSGTCDQMISSDRFHDENITDYLKMLEDRTNRLLTLQSYILCQKNPSQWENDSAIAGHLLGMNPPAVNLPTAATTPAPEDDPDSLESGLLEMKVPMSKEDLLTLVSKRREKTH